MTQALDAFTDLNLAIQSKQPGFSLLQKLCLKHFAVLSGGLPLKPKPVSIQATTR